MKNISKRTWARMVLITVLATIVVFSCAGEKVAHNEGLGWDGMHYYETMHAFKHHITHHSYDQYAIQRVLPWGLTDIICECIGIEVTREVAMISGFIYNAIALFLAVFFFFRISNYKHWKIETEVLGFSFLFFTYPILKYIGYCPVLSDIFGFTIGIMMCYYFFADKKWALITCGFVGAFIWPTTPLFAFALAFFPRKEIPCFKPDDIKLEKVVLQLFFIGLACIPLVMALIKQIRHPGFFTIESRGLYFPLTIPVSEWEVPLACTCSCLFLYYIVSAFKISLFATLKENFTGIDVWKNYMWFIICVVATTAGCRLLANSDPGALTMKTAIYVLAFTSFTDPFVFIESHFFYFGLGYLLVLMFWKDVAKIVMEQGLGYLFVVAVWALFSIRPEARVSIMYIIFPIMALLMYLDTKSIRPYAVIIASIFSLVLSRFWFPINGPDMEHAIDWDNFEHFIDFPAQRLFMSSGHWQSHDMYYLFMTITIIVSVMLYAGIKHQWFIQNNVTNLESGE